MAPLRRRWVEVQTQAKTLAERRDTAKGGQRTKLHNDLANLLMGFADEIAQVRVLDPACGSGNFLYVALKQLLDLEKEVVTLAGDLGVGRFFPAVSPTQLYGIEINPYAHELAQATVWIGYIQWLRDNGFGDPSEPILKPLKNILQMDAILAYDEQGQPVEPEWPDADVIIGNPPFLGGSKLRREFGDVYTENLWKLYSNRVSGAADFVCFWFEKAREQLNGKRIGLLATQTIRIGASRKVLDRIKETGDLFMAWSDRPWVLDGAAVRVSMIGFDDGTEKSRMLNGKLVPFINGDLTSATDLSAIQRLEENNDIAFIGVTKKGSFDIPNSIAQAMLSAPSNPNGRPNSDVIRRWVNAYDVVQHPRGMWIIDFGVDMPESDAVLYELPYEYVRDHVKPERDKVRNKLEREHWWLHGRPAPKLREAIRDLERCIVTPEVAKHRIFAWINTDVVIAHKLYIFARDDDYFFGVLHSRIHEVWSLRISGRHGVGNDPAYNAGRCFETFPLPWPPSKESANDPRVEAIAQAARELVQKRDNWLNPPDADEAELKKRTLTNLYNQRPSWLDMAHKKLDRAVFDAYGWPHDLSDEEILARLLALNLERVKS